jgi:hypothetical protein
VLHFYKIIFKNGMVQDGLSVKFCTQKKTVFLSTIPLIFYLTRRMKLKLSFFTIKINCCCLVMLLMPLYALSQNPITINNDSIYIKNSANAAVSINNNHPYYIVYGNGIENVDCTVHRKLSPQVAIVTLQNAAQLKLLQKQFKIAIATNNWKYAPTMEHIVKQKDKKEAYIITGLSFTALTKAIAALHKQLTIEATQPTTNTLIVKCTYQFIQNSILPLTEVIFIDKYIPAQTEVSIIGYNRSFHGINILDYTMPNANGKNIVVGVKEKRMQSADLDLYKRVLASSLAANEVDNHATVISAIIGGSGNSFYDGRGMANACTFFSSNFSNLFADAATVLNQNNVSVQNHSYGTIPQQFYGAEAQSYDTHTWQNKNFIHVFSAGNKGTAAATNGAYIGIPNYANLTGNFKMAKNVLTIGAVDNTATIANESSAGPLYDGRLAPQLAALGPNGTSDAAAIVTGTVAVLQQVYADSNGLALPTAALVKSILFNTADDIYKTGIDYKTGYGLVNSYAAVLSLQQKEYANASLTQNQTWTKNITVPSNIAQLKITLAWTDTISSLNNNKALVNDLDMELLELSSGTIYQPWVLSNFAHADSLAKLPTRKRDALNTAEQISITLPNAGVYQIKVIGTTVVNPTAFSIAYHYDTLNTFRFLNPQHASDVNRQENETLNIQWKTFVADTNQLGSLYISYTNGANWELIKAAYKIYKNQYYWLIKDTATTAQFKMETSFGIFFSKSFVISPVNRPNVDFLCTDSFQLSWPKHVYANAYKIYALIDSAYLKPILTVTDTFKVLKRVTYPYLTYAVEPILSNGLPAARSVALDIQEQGVKCFYRTLYYEVQDENKINLILELSIASAVDSIYFEQISAQGNIQTVYGGTKISTNNLLYKQLVTTLKAGATYFRAKIKLKNGSVVYTDIIQVITSGTKAILFYPNPVKSNGTLNVILRQGIAADSRLQFFDAYGRLLYNSTNISATINISRMPVGTYWYKLWNTENKLIETGKLIIQ